jgi:ankyrin repeat protein
MERNEENTYLWNLKIKYFNFIENNDTAALLNLMLSTNTRVWELVDQDGNTGLILACYLDYLDTVKIILEVVSKKLNEIDENPVIKNWVDSKNDTGFAALHYASFRGNIKIIKLLISFGCNIGVKNDCGLNVMHMASQGNSCTALAYFSEFHNFSYFCLDDSESSPIHWAAYSGSTEAFEFLVSQKSPLNTQDKDGSTPMHLASLAEKPKIISKLFKLGADYNIKDNSGRKPIDICISKGDEIMLEFISEKHSCCSRTCEIGNKNTWIFVILFLFLFIVNETYCFFYAFKGIYLNFYFIFLISEFESPVYYNLSFFLAAILLFLYLSLVFMDPGYKKRKSNKTFKVKLTLL